MVDIGSPAGRKGLFARLARPLARALGFLKPARGSGLYRPEKHYMRGGGPKSKRIAAASGDGAPSAG
jgi:hypothetical protein